MPSFTNVGRILEHKSDKERCETKLDGRLVTAIFNLKSQKELFKSMRCCCCLLQSPRQGTKFLLAVQPWCDKKPQGDR
jgi:hypothetical protein